MKGEGKNHRNGKSETQTPDNEWTREAKGDSQREEWLFQSVCIMPQTNLPIWRKQGKMFAQSPCYPYSMWHNFLLILKLYLLC